MVVYLWICSKYHLFFMLSLQGSQQTTDNRQMTEVVIGSATPTATPTATEKTTELTEPSIQRGGKLLAKGSFGCVYSPALTCTLTETRNRRAVSKLQIKDAAAEREVEISKIVRQIPNYAASFSPLLEQCDVSPSRLQTSFYDSCPVLKMTPAGKSLLLTRMNFVPGGLLFYYIHERFQTAEIIPAMYKTYRALLQSLVQMRDARVVHYDLADHNIMVHADTKLPIIIDFGLSIDMRAAEEEAVTLAGIRKWFYGYIPEVTFRAPELQLLTYSAFVDPTITKSSVREITDAYMRANKNLKNTNPAFFEMYRDLMISALSKYVGMKPTQIFKAVQSYEGSWDHFAISILYADYALRLIDALKKDEKMVNEIVGKNTQIDVAKFLKDFLELLTMNIHPIPERRLTLEETIRAFDRILFNSTR
jgi:tRNA A-37 threonylcarbamoyl transferase component Bud32